MGSNPTPSAREQGSRRRGWAFEPRVEPPVLRILGSPSAPLFAAPRLRIPPRGSQRAPWAAGWSSPGLGLRGISLSSARLRPASRGLGCEFHWIGGLQHRIVARARTLPPARFSPQWFSQTVDGLRPCMFGRVAEWLKAHDWKSCGLTPTWVRIPPRPLAGEARHRAAWASNPGLSLRRFASSAHLRRRWCGPSVANPTPSACGRSLAPDGRRAVESRGGGGHLRRHRTRFAGSAAHPVRSWRRGRLGGAATLLASGWGRQLCASPPGGGNDFRGVAQSGRALRSGRRGPRFKSGRPDFDSRWRGFRPRADRPGFVRRRSLIGKAPHSKCGGRKPLGVRVPPPPLHSGVHSPSPRRAGSGSIVDLVFPDGADAGRCSLAGI